MRAKMEPIKAIPEVSEHSMSKDDVSQVGLETLRRGPFGWCAWKIFADAKYRHAKAQVPLDKQGPQYPICQEYDE
jgi:hypothetical protein